MGRTFTLSVPDAYTDVAKWLEDLPYGRRSEIVCEILQEHIDRETRDGRILQQILDEIKGLRADIPPVPIGPWTGTAPDDTALDGETKQNLGGLLK